MLLSLLFFIISITLLYLSSHSLIKNLIKFFYRLFHSRHTSINLLFFLLLPGIFLHEFSHILSAELLQVRTGHLSLTPHFKDNQLRLGSAQIAKTDPIRLTLIGTAPFLTGTIALWLILKLGLHLSPSILNITNFLPQLTLAFKQISFLPLLLLTYLLFSISNTMFSSPSDLQSAGLPIILFLIIFGVIQLTNFSLPTSIISSIINLFFLLGTIFTLILLLNLIILLPLKLANRQS